MRLREIELEIIKEKTKQLQLELEILRLTQSQSVEHITALNPMEELVKNFLQSEKIITANSKEYIFLYDIYERLKVWLHSNGCISVITLRDILTTLIPNRKIL
jgi:hypothetical protein